MPLLHLRRTSLDLRWSSSAEPAARIETRQCSPGFDSPAAGGRLNHRKKSFQRTSSRKTVEDRRKALRWSSSAAPAARIETLQHKLWFRLVRLRRTAQPP